jgi:hypothetical protein
MFQIFVRIPTNRTLVFDVERSTTGRDIKRLIWWREGIPVEIQWLCNGVRLLHDDTALYELNIERESTVWCHIRGRADEEENPRQE